VRVHPAGEHALEFQRLDPAGETLDVVGHRAHGALVALLRRELQQLVRTAQALAELADAVDDAVELGAFLAQLLGALGLIPEPRILELARDFLEPLALGIVVKDTPEAKSGARSSRRCDGGWDWFRS
jgi:hypothetical protein